MIEDLNVVVLPDPDPSARNSQIKEQFAQANASLALEGMIVDATDLSIQDKIASGEITIEQAIDFYRVRASKGIL